MKHRLRCGFLIVAAAAGLAWLAAGPARAEKSPSIIRDTEIENDLHDWTGTLIRAGGLEPDQVHFIIVDDNEINSFVAGGPNIFLFTGIILNADNANQVIGVIAHELGHIRGGHLIRGQEAMRNASYEALLGTVLGLGAAIAGNGGAAGAGVMAGQSTALNSFLAFSRTQEASADQSALFTLQRACLSPKGLVDFFTKLEDQQGLPENQQTAWMRTHPLTQERIDAMQDGYEHSTCKEHFGPPAWDEQQKRIKAKLVGFVTPEQVKWTYPGSDNSIPAAYARTIAAYRLNHPDEAMRDMDALLAREPKNPYFLELRGQILADFGHGEEALPDYRQSIAILGPMKGGAPLIRTAYANTLIANAARDPRRLDDAIEQLELAGREEPRSSLVARLQATAWGMKGNDAMAKLYLAEEAVMNGHTAVARQQANAALHGLKPGSRPYLMAQDLLSYLDGVRKEKKPGE